LGKERFSSDRLAERIKDRLVQRYREYERSRGVK